MKRFNNKKKESGKKPLKLRKIDPVDVVLNDDAVAGPSNIRESPETSDSSTLNRDNGLTSEDETDEEQTFDEPYDVEKSSSDSHKDDEPELSTRGKVLLQSLKECAPVSKFLEITSESSKFIKGFEVYLRETRFRRRESSAGVDELQCLEDTFEELRMHLTKFFDAEDYIGITMDDPTLSKRELWNRFCQVQAFKTKDIHELFSKGAQSDNTSDLNRGECRLTSCVVLGINGGVGKRLTHEDVFKRSIIRIENNDNLCLPRSLVVALAHAERGQTRGGKLQQKWKKISDKRRDYQREIAEKLVRDSGIKIPRRGCSVTEIAGFQRHFAKEGIAIIVYEFLTLGKNVPALYNGTNEVISRGIRVKHTLYILYYEESQHFNPIVNLTGATGSRGFCVNCNVKYTRVLAHRCKYACTGCRSSLCDGKKNNEIVLKCHNCRRVFFGKKCYDQHKKKNSAGLRGKKKEKSVCDALKICKKCELIIKIDECEHRCGEKYCKTCKCKFKQENNSPHKCYMSPLKKILKKNTTKMLAFIFYDFETQQNVHFPSDSTTRLHVPNLCVAHRVCNMCLNDHDIKKDCKICGKREFEFTEDPVMQLINLAFDERFQKTICIAHNAGNFDGQFILRYLVEKKKSQLPKIIMTGTKIISMTIGTIVFLDSVNYLPMPLSALPKTFGFEEIVVKGKFPHLFNTPENQDYEGSLPPIEYYSPDSMFPKDRANFLRWYNRTKGSHYKFNLKKELLRYCRTDVTILRRACLAFRQLFIRCGNVCPFVESFTIASTCFKVYRKNFLQPNVIGILPSRGYRRVDTQSYKAISWLVWCEKQLNCTIEHAGRARERRLPNGLGAVDGYYEKAGNKYVYQFHGCFWHGCPNCANTEDSIIKDQKYGITREKSKRIEAAGYNLTEMWECEFDRMVQENEEMRNYLKHHPMVRPAPLDPREAFFGGRTENFVNLYDAQPGEKILYVDVCSLYPWVCKVGKFPIGHPELYVGVECQKLTGKNNDLSKIEGLVKCVVLPPRNLYHPVLPVRMHDKLLFALCRECCETMNPLDCMHEDVTDRQFNGTWVVDELRKAVVLGYIIVRIDEIWQYKIRQYDTKTRKGGIFADYINTFLKIKQEASGPPEECDNDDVSLEAYIASYEKAEGIRLDKTAIIYNPGLRYLAKLALNSFWGKFGQRDNLPKTVIVASRPELINLLTNPVVKVTGLLPVNHRRMYVNYVHTKNAIQPGQHSNVVIAAYTTAQARLKLYEYLEELGDRALYCDTDSCIYVSRDDDENSKLKTGEFLGDLKDELGSGSHIKSFVSGGPKFYAYIVRKPDGTTEEVCKVKGITLNFTNSNLVNYHSIRSFVCGQRRSEILLKNDEIRRTKFHHVTTETIKKKCTPVDVKRRRDGNHNTLPYGYVAPNIVSLQPLTPPASQY